MYTFRFNPVFEQWVLLGGQFASSLAVSAAHKIDVGRSGDFTAVTYPRQPFLLDPPSKTKHAKAEPLVYAQQPAVGEYELLLFEGREQFPNWELKQWEAWLMLIQQRLLQAHHNPHLHHAAVFFHTKALATVEGCQRVGELVATSHPIAGMSVPLHVELVRKIRHKEDIFIVRDHPQGCLYVPSAPTHEKEIWYIPGSPQPGFETIDKPSRHALAKDLRDVFQMYATEFPTSRLQLTLHTALADKQSGTTWWVQIHEEDGSADAPVLRRNLPEQWVQQLHFMLRERR